MPAALMMRGKHGICAVLIVLFLAGSIALALEVEGLLAMPDSFGITKSGWSDFDSATGKLYIAGSFAVASIQAPQTRRSGRIDLPVGGRGRTSRPFIHHGLGKLYLVPYDTAIAVIRTVDDSVLGFMPAPASPHLRYFLGGECAVLAEELNRLYVMTNGSCAVYCLLGDTLLHTVQMPMTYAVGQMTFNTVSSKFYVGVGNNQLAIFHAGPDTLIDVVQAGDGASDLGYLARHNKVYFSNYTGSSVSIFCGAGDSLITELPTPGGPMTMVMNELEGKGYLGVSTGYAVICGKTDSVLKVLDLPGGRGCAGIWHAPTNTMYLSSPGHVSVVDGVTDSLLNVHHEPLLGTEESASHPDAIYFYGIYNQMTCLDPTADSLVWHDHYTGITQHSVAWSSFHRRLFVGSSRERVVFSQGFHPLTSPAVAVLPRTGSVPTVVTDDETGLSYAVGIDGPPWVYQLDSTGALTDSIPLSGFPRSEPLLAPGGGRLYVGVRFAPDEYELAIIATEGNRLVRTIPLDGNPDVPGVASLDAGKVYWKNGEGMVTVCLHGDSLLDRIVLPGRNTAPTAMFVHPTNGLVYISVMTDDAPQGIYVFEATTDSVVRVIQMAPRGQFVYVPRWDKLYAAGGHTIVVDCAENRILKVISLPHGPLVYNPVADRLYAPYGRSHPNFESKKFVLVIDCATDTPVSYVPVGAGPRLGVDPDSGYVFAACENSVIYVIRDQTPPGTAEPDQDRDGLGPWLKTTPNPTLGGVLVELSLPDSRRVELTVYDASGRRVRLLVHKELGPDRVTLLWDGTDGNARLPAGTYFVQLTGTSLSSKVVLKRQ
ncbi:MAG TPA: T9SS type A sorting domain-containing protein [candidate division WOR-3 bacterium]|uniref:T9SS type A sorting domain-containing protein n=1 Tax=candidate division WOR-3 bacterium TaxID=2052148 RepID=A0A7V0T6J0_UNCW3|nr:T9SS type A sorting domain-containing protein [candidate division WOR-3 bacterium]